MYSVEIKVTPGCPREFRSHGIAPAVNGKFGTVAEEESPGAIGDHHLRVVMADGRHQWFKPSEVIRLDTQTQG